jgi:hypothetical protein
MDMQQTRGSVGELNGNSYLVVRIRRWTLICVPARVSKQHTNDMSANYFTSYTLVDTQKWAHDDDEYQNQRSLHVVSYDPKLKALDMVYKITTDQ